MAENTDNTIDPKAPPLPKGYEPIKKEVNSVPPLPPGYIPLKKKESTGLPSTTTPSNSDLGGAMDSSDTSNNNGFPKIDTNSVAPGFGMQPNVNKQSEKPKSLRLPNASYEVEMQRRGITPPPSEMLKQTANNTKDLYDLDANGNVIPKKPNKLFAGLKKQDKTKGFYQQGEELVKKNNDIQNGFSEKTTFELVGGKLIPKTTVKDFKTSEGIDKEIEDNDLNLDHPYLYYSTFDKENQPKDTFVESNFGENKLADIGINTADFDGFLNKKGYKAEFLDKEANGLFEGKGTDLTGGYNIQLAKEIQKERLLNLYMQDINSRDFAKRKLKQEKVNLGKLGRDREQLNTQYTLFDSNKVGAFYEKEMPILTQKLKERDAENLKIYEQHKKGDAGFFYGIKQVLNSGWNGFLDRVNQTSSTMLDKIGLDSGADELRLLNEERQIQRPNTRDVGYASGRTTTYDGVDYLVTNDGQIIDKDKKIRVTDLFFKPTYDAIVNKSKSGEEDSVFSFQGSAIQAGGVLGDMIVQVALQRGVGLASGATVKAGSLLSKIPISKSIGSAIIAQSALGYSQGLEQTYKAAIDAGIDEKTAKVLATDAAQRMAGLYAVTAPISPQTKAIQAIFGTEGKELIKKAIASYSQAGKKGFVETFKGGIKVLAKNGAIFSEEGGKEVFQENIQQYGENYGVNHVTNREAGRELVKETISGDEFVNTSILSFASGGLMTLPGMFSSTDKLKTLQQLSKDPLVFEKNLKEMVSKGVFTNDKADILRKDVKIYSNQSHKIPKNLNKDIAMEVMYDLQDISELELKKKGLDKSFHEELDAEIEAKRTSIKSKIKEKSNQTEDEQLQTTTTETQQETQSKTEVQETEQEVNTTITDLEKQRDSEIEALKAKRQYDEKNISPIREKYEALILKEKSKETDAKIKNKELFKDGGSFSNQLGESGVDSVATNHTEINGIEFVQFSNPNTGVVDVIMSGTSDSDFVGYYRIYENGKPTDKWSSKFENQSRNKENFKTMISGVQSMLPENHEYTEKTSISTDGLRVWEQQLNRGYEIQTDENGNIVTNEVAINGDAINNELGIDVNQGNFDNISVNNNQQFESVKKALLPYLKKLGLNETNVKWENGTVIIDLPILRKKSTNEATPTQQAEAEKVEIKNEGNSDAPTKENIDERLRINHPFYEKVSDALDKLGLISKYNPETKEGDVVGGYTQPTSNGGFSVGGFIFSKDGSVSFIKDGARVEFDKNGNVISENTKEVAQEKNKIEIKGTKESITNLEKTRDSESFKYKEVTETDVLGNRKKVKRLKTAQELKESTDKINAAINKAKSRLTELEKNQPKEVSPVEDVVAPSVEKKKKSILKSDRDLLGNEKEEAMLSVEFDKELSVGDDLKIKGVNAPDYNANFRGYNQDGDIVVFNKETGSQSTIKRASRIEILNEKKPINGFPEAIKYAIENDLYQEWINDGKISKEDVVNIITSAKLELPKFLKNEATPPTNPPADGNVQLGASNVGESGNAKPKSNSKSSVPSSVDVGESKGSAKVKKIKLTDKGQAFNVERKNGKLAVTNTKGEPVSKPTERAVLRKYADNFDFTNGDKAIERSDFEGNPDAYNGEIAKKSNNPSEIAETIIYAEITDNNGAIKEPTIDHKQAIIADSIVPITEKGFIDSSDVNDIAPSMKKHYFDDNGRKIDDLAQEMSERAGVEITPKDITDFIKENPKGVKDFYKKGKNKIAESGVLASNEIFDLKAKFEDITGLPATNEFLLKAIEQQNRKNENESVLDNMSDEDFEKAYNDAQQFKKENYGNSEKNTTSESNNESENTPSNERKQRVQGDNTKKPTIKERVAERVKLSDAKIDANSDLIKAKLKAFKDMFPSADINPDDYNTNGFSAEAIVDMVAKAAKSLIEAGITIDEAIKQAIEGYNTHFDDVVDADAVKEKVSSKEESKDKTESKPKPDLEAFRDSWNKDPSSDEINQYDSGRTINREHGELRNNQNYEVQKDLARVQIGIKAIEHAKELFGAEYVEKTLSFIEQANLSPEKKAVAYVLLENEMDARAKEFPDNVGVKKLQDLVRAKSQAFLANSARAMGAGRFRIERFRELAKNGFSEEELTNAILTTQQIKDKEKIQKLSQVTPDDINAEADMQESHVVDSDLEQLISEGVEKQLNGIYKKLPTSRRVRADKAISALENIQKKLRGKAYDATIGVPIAIIDSGITIIKNSIKAGVNIADAIEIGINHIKSKYGKDWKKEDDFRKDMRDGFEEEGVNVKDKAPKEISQEQKAKDLVKKALIDAGFSREITVRNKNGKEKRNVLDWKKLAGEAGTIDNIRKNVEESLKNSNYSKNEIEAMKDALEKEYVRLTADVIEKGLNELQNRNAPRKPINTKSAARKLAELHNYGLFEKNKDSYEKIINNVLGVNELDQKAFEEMKHIAKGYAVLMDSGLSETETKDAINSLSRRQSRLVDTLAFSQASWRFKLAVAFREITNLSIRFKLVNLGNLAENISSGMMARASNRMIDAMANIKKGEKTSNKALRNQSKTNARAKLKGITLEASESYGDTSSLLLNHSAVEDYFNNSTTNKVYHAIISTYMAKPVLEGADSFNKILITEAKMVRATIKVLQAKGMTNKDALDYVAKALTGESMKEAIVKSKNLILEVNNKSGKKLLNDSESAVQSLASDIVKESLVSGGQITETELKAIYNAAYKSAGKDIGHVSNNWVTDWISAKGAQIEKRVADAIKEKKWNVAAGEVVNQWIWKSFISTFVAGGTNWFIKGLQKSSNPLSLISLREDSMRLKMAGKLDVTTDEGIKNMEEVLYRGMNLRSTGGSMIMGAIITASIISSMMATGADDELAEWLKNNPWAKKFFDKLVPDAVVLMLAINDKDYWRYIAKTINVKADFFDDQKNIAKILTKYAEGRDEDDAYKTAEASGDLGVMLGKRFDFPGPLRAVKDAKQIYKGAVKGKYDETDYYTSGFLNGFFQGGIVEGLGLRKDPTLENKKSTKGIMEGRLHPKRKTAEEKRESRRTREENERELMKKAREEGVRYVPPRR